MIVSAIFHLSLPTQKKRKTTHNADYLTVSIDGIYQTFHKCRGLYVSLLTDYHIQIYWLIDCFLMTFTVFTFFFM